MKKKIRLQAGQSLLFVCYGNTCRSPMAEGLARQKLAGAVFVASAGLSPGFSGAQPEAITAMKQMFDVDISSHLVRGLPEFDLEKFHWIIVLDPYVYEHLRHRLPDVRPRLRLWPIEDPFGRDLGAYLTVGKTLNRLFERCLVSPRVSRGEPCF
jgi:protein-tyrosine-phosphatase